MTPYVTIERFDQFLVGRRMQFEAVVIGGSALALLGIIERPTQDVDVLAPELPIAIAEVAREFARAQRADGWDLFDDWLNNGPMALASILPVGWRDRCTVLFSGTALLLHTLGRTDLLKTKLFALCDRGIDLTDCLALAPTSAEIAESTPWLEQQDANEQWPAHVRSTLTDLSRRLGHGV